jgi:predicted  nucleic acid-binding Zn-ribbon protein
MRTRHRIPTIFNLSMVDVLCCALGCVILLWLLNLREAKQRAQQAGATGDQLAAAVKERDQLYEEMRAAQAKAGDLERSLRSSQGQLEAVKDRLRGATEALAKTEAERAAARKQMEKKLADADKQIAALEGQVREKDALLVAGARKADGLQDKLSDAEARARKLQALADQLADLQKDATSQRDKVQSTEARVRQLEQEVAEKSKALAAADNRFAGIALTGKRVIFLVDMSGSMDLVDENTPAPKKWLGVRETVVKVMKSLPELEKFQVILFAEKAKYLLGGDGGWLDYDPKTSAEKVFDALARTRPDGGTNMYVAMQAAFQYRVKGLDTIYLLSDGLPNIGEGLPANARDLKEMERCELLSKYIRKTLKTSWNRAAEGRPRVRINAVGFFYESPDVGAFLWALARENDGSFVGMSQP